MNATGQAAREHRAKEIQKNFGFWSLLKRFRIISCVICNSVSLSCLTFKEPILALKLTFDYHVSIMLSGLIFSLDTITYTITSMVLQCVGSTTSGSFYGRLMYFGVIVFGLSMIL